MKRNSSLWMLLPVLWASAAAAQTDIEAPRSYALVNGRVVVAPGRVLERATVVVRDGRIEAVGERVQVPAGVIPMDITGLTVYPGLVDAASSIGLPLVAPQGGGFRGGGPAQGESDGPPPELSPGRAAVEAFSPGDDDLAALRAAGVTVVGLAFDGGIFPGRVSAVTTRDAAPARLVLRPAVAQQVAFGRRRGGYPGTLMGALAYIEQSFKDARHEALVQAAFERDPAAAPVPAYDPEHRALQPAAAGTMPVWLHASTAADIKRAIRLAQELGITNYVIVGAQEGYQVAAQLKAAGKPVIVSLDFPNPNQLTGRAWEMHVAPVSGPDRADENADSAAARTARANAAALVKAGLPIALSSLGGGPSDFRSGLIAAVEAGLSPDDALRAVTVNAARVLGLDARIGTVEAGRMANLLVVQGDLFSRDARIRHVFVQGERYDIPAAAASGNRGRAGGPGGRAGGGGAAAAAGQWQGSVDAEGQAYPFTLTITGAGSDLSASLSSEMGTTPLSGAQTGSDISLTGTVTTPEGEMRITVTGTIEGDRMTGSIGLSGMGTFTFTARRGGASGSAREDGGNR